MRFPVQFSREKGGTNPPPTLPSTGVAPTSAPNVNMDNLLSVQAISKEGWPVQRIAAYWTTTAATPTSMSANLYQWDDELSLWVLVNDAPVAMKFQQMYFFDCAVLTGGVPTQNANGSLNINPANPGPLEVALVIFDPGAQVNGTFVIAMGADLSTVGT